MICNNQDDRIDDSYHQSEGWFNSRTSKRILPHQEFMMDGIMIYNNCISSMLDKEQSYISISAKIVAVLIINKIADHSEYCKRQLASCYVRMHNKN